LDPLSKLLPSPLAGEAGHFAYAARRPWCTWNGMHGGSLMGTLISAMEQLAGKPMIAATHQFLKGIKEDDSVDIRAEITASSATVTQARVSATQAGALVATTLGTCGEVGRVERGVGRFPAVPPADAAPIRPYLRPPLENDIHETIEVRVAEVLPTRVRLWARCGAGRGQPFSAPLLAAFADQPPLGVKLVLGGDWYGISLEASLRVVRPLVEFDAGQWLLIDAGFDAMAASFAFATANIWTSDGTLLAIAQQSMRIRHGTVPTRG
jgi:acyl-CoA thioesterase